MSGHYAGNTNTASQRRHVPDGAASRGNAKGKRKASAASIQGRSSQENGTRADDAGPSRRRKERDPNWSKDEILALVEAKRLEHLEEMEVIDARDLMSTDVTKWGKIAREVNAITGGGVVREGPACKHKWTSTMADFKRIADYHKGTGRNAEEYFLITYADRRKENLPRSFFKEVYANMYEFFMSRPIMNPPHHRDLLRPEDGNYASDNRRGSASDIHADVKDDESFMDSQPDSYYMSDSLGDSANIPVREETRESSPDVSHWGNGAWTGHPAPENVYPAPPPQRASTVNIGGNPSFSHGVPGGSMSHPQGQYTTPVETAATAGGGGPMHSPVNTARQSPTAANLPTARHSPRVPLRGISPQAARTAGMAGSGQAGRPHILSSLGTSTYDVTRLNRNTGQRRNGHTRHKLMADVTAEAGEKMVKTLQDMTHANKEMEGMRLEMASKMHAEQMEYKRDKDRLELENMRLALLNQGLVVNAISSLAEAIGRSAQQPASPYPPRPAPVQANPPATTNLVTQAMPSPASASRTAEDAV